MKQKRKNKKFLKLSKKSYFNFYFIIKKQISKTVNNIKNLVEKSYKHLEELIDFVHLNIKKLEDYFEFDMGEDIKETVKEPLTTGAFLKLLTVNTASVEVFKELKKEIDILNIARKIVYFDQKYNETGLFKDFQINNLFDNFENIDNQVEKEKQLEEIYKYEKQKKITADMLIFEIKASIEKNENKMDPQNKKILNKLLNKLTDDNTREKDKIIKKLNNVRNYLNSHTIDNKKNIFFINYFNKNDLKTLLFSVFKIKAKLTIETLVVSSIIMGSLSYINPDIHHYVEQTRGNLNRIEKRYVPSPLLRNVFFEYEQNGDKYNNCKNKDKKIVPKKYLKKIIIKYKKAKANEENEQKHIENILNVENINKNETKIIRKMFEKDISLLN